MVVTEHELSALSVEERRVLAAALLADGCPLEPSDADRRRRRRFLAFVAVAVVVLAAWIVALGTTLPQHESTGQWRTAWVGFDIGLLLSLAVCGWAAWRGRQLLIPATLVTGTLLFCDAWFDVVLSWDTDERWWSVVSAAAVEIPLAVAFWAIARRLVRRAIAIARVQVGLPGAAPSLTSLRLFDPLLTR